MSKEFSEDGSRDSAARTDLYPVRWQQGARTGTSPVPLGVLQTEIAHRKEELRALEREIRALAMHPMSRRKADLRRQVRAEKRFLKDLARAASQYELF